MFDLDNFKQHNDAHGHSAGDELLCALAEGLRGRLRATDVTGRLGGDEFAALLPNADAAHAHARHRVAARAHPRRSSGREPVAADDGVTASIGMVCLDRLEPLTPEAVMRAADQAMYEAKRRGRNRMRRVGADARRASFLHLTERALARAPCPRASAAAWCRGGCGRRWTGRS